MNRTERVSDLLAVTSRLIGCMEQEVALLHSMRASDIAGLQADKTRLADAYEAHIAALRAGTGADETLAPEMVQALTSATERLQAAIGENVRALRAAREVNDKVLKAIVAAVEQDRKAPAAYGRMGAAGARRAVAGAAVSVSLDGRF
jgi:hypothetical protein